MKTFIVSMSLFAVVVAYVALRSLDNKTESDMPAVAAKGKTENAEYSAVAAYRKSRKTSEEDWSAVRAIAPECAEEIGDIVALRENLKASEFYRPKNWGSRNPEVRAKIGETNFAVWQAAKTVRDLEREQ